MKKKSNKGMKKGEWKRVNGKLVRIKDMPLYKKQQDPEISEFVWKHTYDPSMVKPPKPTPDWESIASSLMLVVSELLKLK